ncbi:MAG: chemotaxis response regulator protein-glutamate methylesterase [Candidatus Cohnella colombiensis]|uniref:Protein-glutamate methylesterase/protein-glutamine glutaminase n=1 Tax=Candidatus Cohnella colombiensis TaxID=3121368 RepID=A0AA95JFV9_9BACL|nr:MAG: chemotaxis response regulator protein-glutamate methylesterase [Cohnella sp.]
MKNEVMKHENNRIKVLIVDDSMVFREVIARSITMDQSIKVVAKATDPFDARDKIISCNPDVMICDVEMPQMNGIEFLRRLLPQHPLPVIVVSSISDAVFDAMNVGAVDFIPKPDIHSSISMESFIDELIQKVKMASRAKISRLPVEMSKHLRSTSNVTTDLDMIAVGASTGGTEAIYNLLKHVPNDYPGFVIVQHIPEGFSRMFAERLNQSTPWRVKEAETGDLIEPGKVLLAPGNKHMRVKKEGKQYRVICEYGEKVNGHCPSVDILFESVAKEVREKAIGVILTGMGYDGARGLLAMRRRGARTIGQDEKSSVVYGMPKVAFELGAVEKQAPIMKIPLLLEKIIES